MQITRTAVSLNVPDVAASADFARAHFGFVEQMAADGFVSLGHPTAGVNLTFLRTGLPSFQPAEIAGSAGQGLLLAFVVDGLDAEFDASGRPGPGCSPSRRPNPGVSGSASSPTRTAWSGSWWSGWRRPRSPRPRATERNTPSRRRFPGRLYQVTGGGGTVRAGIRTIG